MNTLVIVNGTDITQYIDWASYALASQDIFQSWTDGNFVEHRIYSRSRISGTFRVWLCGKNGMNVDAFMTLWNGATHNHITTLGVYDNVANEIKAINAYCNIVPESHREMVNGDYFDILTIEVTER